MSDITPSGAGGYPPPLSQTGSGVSSLTRDIQAWSATVPSGPSLVEALQAGDASAARAILADQNDTTELRSVVNTTPGLLAVLTPYEPTLFENPSALLSAVLAHVAEEAVIRLYQERAQGADKTKKNNVSCLRALGAWLRLDPSRPTLHEIALRPGKANEDPDIKKFRQTLDPKSGNYRNIVSAVNALRTGAVRERLKPDEDDEEVIQLYRKKAQGADTTKKNYANHLRALGVWTRLDPSRPTLHEIALREGAAKEDPDVKEFRQTLDPNSGIYKHIFGAVDALRTGTVRERRPPMRTTKR